ncbi:MAG: hypothetical protein ACO3N7_08125 [Kiritimatiellia bacterium]
MRRQRVRPFFLILLLSGICTGLQADTRRLFEESVVFSERAEEDFFTLANEVVLSGEFDEDVWAAGRKIRFTGQIADDARFYALEMLQSDGLIEGNLWAASGVGNLLLDSNSVVYGNAVLQAGKRVTVRGRIDGDLWVEAPSVLIEAEILGNLTLRAGEIQLMPGTVVHGDLLNRNPKSLPLPAGVRVDGERKQISDEPGELSARIRNLKWMIRGLQFVSAYLIGLLLLRVLPRFTGQNVELLLHHRNPALSIGIFSFLFLSVTGYFLLLSVLGIGVGLFVLLLTGLLFYLGKIMVAYAIGMILLRQRSDLSFGKLALALFIGLLVLYSAYSLLYIGGALYFMTSCWGMGAILTSIRNSQRVLKIQVPPSLKNPQG